MARRLRRLALRRHGAWLLRPRRLLRRAQCVARRGCSAPRLRRRRLQASQRRRAAEKAQGDGRADGDARLRRGDAHGVEASGLAPWISGEAEAVHAAASARVRSVDSRSTAAVGRRARPGYLARVGRERRGRGGGSTGAACTHNQRNACGMHAQPARRARRARTTGRQTRRARTTRATDAARTHDQGDARGVHAQTEADQQ